MEFNNGKLFIGGISWETTEDRLQEYFKKFGKVMEVIIMKDRISGRGRGFGFLVFADASVSERVILEKHLIDGRMVEAKKAVPKDHQHMLNRTSFNSTEGSPGPGRTKKIFVGGLASTVTDADFKKYFEQFGSITDVVVMYDHNTQRPRGFGFITFDAEDAVDKVLHKTFHELNGKMVEVKRAVPKELLPGPNGLSPIGAYSLNRINCFLSGCSPTQGYNPSSIGSYGMRIDGRFEPLASGRKGLPSFDPGYGTGMDFEPGMIPIYSGNYDFNGRVDHGRTLSPYHSGNSSRFGSPISYGGISGSPGLTFSPTTRNLWGNGDNYGTNPAGSNAYMTSGNGRLTGYGNVGHNWGAASSFAAHGLASGSDFIFGNLNYGSGENRFDMVVGSYRRNSPIGSISNSFVATNNGVEGNFKNLYNGSSVYGDATWQSASSELDGSSKFGYELGVPESKFSTKIGPTVYVSDYKLSNRQMNRGICLNDVGRVNSTHKCILINQKA